MTISLDELLEKWLDVAQCADDRAERTLAEEIVDDLKELRKVI